MLNIEIRIKENIAFEDIANLDYYIRRVGGAYQKGNLLIIGVGHDIEDFKPGKYLYKYIKDGIITSVTGLVNLNHYIKLPLSFMNETNSTISQYDEEGNQLEDSIITNKEAYNIFIFNSTDCLIRLTDSNYQSFLSMMICDNINPNVFCNDKFNIEYNLNFNNNEEN